MGVFSTPQRHQPYVPPMAWPAGGLDGSPREARATLLGGAPNEQPLGKVVPASDLADASGDVQTQVSQGPSIVGARGDSDRGQSDYHLRFNGRYLSLHDGERVVRSWPAVSGKENFGSAQNQEKRDYGPIPEASYDIKQSRYQRIGDINSVIGTINKGEWPGSIPSWGQHRVWADPTAESVRDDLTFGRSGMAIHGGWIPGSAGCIDLTKYMPDFVKTFRRLGRDLKLYVDYTPPSP